MTVWLKDNERCYFGLGWEYRRKGIPLDDCPFPMNSYAREQFVNGWKTFVCSKEVDY